MSLGCQWIGPDQDPRLVRAVTYCGAPCINGKAYCHKHYFKVYSKGTSINGKKFTKKVDEELKSIEENEHVEFV